MKIANCLLSEWGHFDAKAKPFCIPRWWYLLPTLSATVIMFLASLAGTHAIEICFRAEPLIAVGVQGILDVRHLYGYVPELAHAFFYLFVAPILIFAAFRFLSSADAALRSLTYQQRLVGKPCNGVRSSVAARNRNFFLFLPLAFLLLALGYNLSRELKSYHANAVGSSHTLGYVQAPFVQSWINHFNQGTNQQRWDKFPSATLRKEFVKGLEEKLDETVYENLLSPVKASLKWRGNPTKERKEELYGARKYSIDVPALLTAGKSSIVASVRGGPKSQRQSFWFWLFLVTLMVCESIFHAFAVWIVFKTAFWLWVVYGMLPPHRSESQSFRLLPRFNDSTCRYGLGPLYAPYNWIVLLPLTGALGFSLNQISNEAKGTSAILGVMPGFFAGQGGILILVVIVFIALAFGPMWLFSQKMANSKRRYLRYCEKMMARHHRDPRKVQMFQERSELASEQSAWPSKDPQFKRIGIFAVAFILLPLVAAKSLPIPAQMQQASTITDFLKTCVDSIAQTMLP